MSEKCILCSLLRSYIYDEWIIFYKKNQFFAIRRNSLKTPIYLCWSNCLSKDRKYKSDRNKSKISLIVLAISLSQIKTKKLSPIKRRNKIQRIMKRNEFSQIVN